jgi:RNA polymerase sigma-70 factor, ECF subfamily
VYDQRTDEELFAEVVQRRAAGQAFGGPLGALVERWGRPARYVVSKIQASYGRGSPADADELFQDAVGKFIDRGLDQFRGISEQMPGKSASPKTFFLRIVKHVAIDFYRRQREDLAPAPRDPEDAPEESPVQISRAVESSRRGEERSEAQEFYWAAFARLQREHPKEAGAWELYHHLDVEDHVECARRLEITVANSYKRVSRAQAYLKLYLLEARQTAEAEAAPRSSVAGKVSDE